MRARRWLRSRSSRGSAAPRPRAGETIKERVHGIMVGELQAMGKARGGPSDDLPDAAWEWMMDMGAPGLGRSRATSTSTFAARVLLDGQIGWFPGVTILWRCACAAARGPPRGRREPWPRGAGLRRVDELSRSRKDGRSDPRACGRLRCSPTSYLTRPHGLERLTKLDPGRSERRRRGIDLQETIDERFNLVARRMRTMRAHLRSPARLGGGAHGPGDRAPDQDDAALAGDRCRRCASTRPTAMLAARTAPGLFRPPTNPRGSSATTATPSSG